MATTSRKDSGVGRKPHASSAGGAKGDTPSKTGGDGGLNAGNGRAANATSAADKIRKSGKMVRDSFKMPQRDYDLIDEVKKRCRAVGIDVKKSEVLRAGLLTIRELSDERLGEVLEPLTVGRADRGARKRAKTATAA